MLDSHVLKQLEQLDAVDFIDRRGRIHYAHWFVGYALDQYVQGKGPKQIFIEAGFPVEIMGYKRVERAMSRWRKTAGIDATRHLH
ncbi:hypothetical protein GCM10007377_15060 [Galliscardovia ingluviei]|uniref:Uncharacterized protein n=1 Tax=Galliscardovia ingluviei TaxID=1769422 RepID=A0A8J3AKC5_9BIFI|nr:hypothetical protein [Galliscardovia ingluviei]GGI15269.1 hypothetical protein GCM10007377_15060 [Galliscardovia ingluviei]